MTGESKLTGTFWPGPQIARADLLGRLAEQVGAEDGIMMIPLDVAKANDLATKDTYLYNFDNSAHHIYYANAGRVRSSEIDVGDEYSDLDCDAVCEEIRQVIAELKLPN